jgi:hypothetical protein
MTKTLENLFVILHYASTAIFIGIFLIFYKRLSQQKQFITIAAYCTFDLIINFLPHHLYFISGIIATLLEYALFSMVIWYSIKSLLIKKLILVISLAFFVFIIIHSITTEIKSFDSIPIGIETILILLYSFYYLYEQMNNIENLFIYSQYQFWIIVGFMIYLSGSFFIYIFANQVDSQTITRYWFLTNVFFVLMTISFFFSVYIFTIDLKKSTPYKLYQSLN